MGEGVGKGVGVEGGTVGGVEVDAAVATLEAIRSYVLELFDCTDCQDHFRTVSANVAAQVTHGPGSSGGSGDSEGGEGEGISAGSTGGSSGVSSSGGGGSSADSTTGSTTGKNAVLWLWHAHNNVTQRLASSFGWDAQKALYPSRSVCADCYVTKDGVDGGADASCGNTTFSSWDTAVYVEEI